MRLPSPTGRLRCPRSSSALHTPSSGALHPLFRANGTHAAEEVPADAEGPTGLSRYRNAAMVGAGGLTCAAIGAFLGGLGGYFTVNPAATHPFASSAGSNQPLATAVDQAYRVASLGDSADEAMVSFSSPSGTLAHSVDPLQWLTTSRSDNLAVSPATVSNLPGLAAGSGLGGLGLGCATQSDVGVGCILGGVTNVLGTIESGSSDPAAVVEELLPSLSGVVSDVTGTLSNLGALLPLGSLPTAGLPTAVLEELGLGSGGSGLGPLGSLGGSLGSLGSLGAGGAGSLPGSTTGSLDPVLNGILAAAGASASSTTGSHSSAGGSSSGLPVSAPSGSLSSSASSGRSTTTTTSSTTTTTKPSGGGSGGTTVTVPLPALPVPSTPPVSVGGVSVGLNSSSSGSGLSLSLP